MQLFILFMLAALPMTYGYHILCMQTMPMRSHYIMMRAIVDVLLKAGHEVTMVTTYPDSDPVKNLTMIDVSQVKKIIDDIDLADRSRMRSIDVTDVARNVSRAVVESARVKDAVVNGNFDAVVSERFNSDLEAGFAAVLQVPWIVLTSTLSPQVEYLVDTFRSIPTIPLMTETIPMNFGQRVRNTFRYLSVAYKSWVEMTKTNADYEHYFGPLAKARNVPLSPFSKAIHNISILFVNSHPSIAPARSVPPNVIDIAGYHIGDIPPLPQDLQNLLDSSKQGVIYFSMGSALKSAGFSGKVKNELITVFGSLPFTVLWKFEDTLQRLPKNVHIRSWIPQSSVLAHPNIKVFITHGGLLSSLEALQNGIPTIVVPVFGDQPSNAARAVAEGLAIKVDFSANMADDLGLALKMMFSNDSYTKRAKSLSALFRDKPVPPSELIQHYVELAIRSKGAYHLRSVSLLYRWYESWMLDQAVALCIILYTLYFVIKILIKAMKKPKNKTIKKH